MHLSYLGLEMRLTEGPICVELLAYGPGKVKRHCLMIQQRFLDDYRPDAYKGISVEVVLFGHGNVMASMRKSRKEEVYRKLA
jgi:hypothetical protein